MSRTIPIADATVDQLLYFATTILGLDIHHAVRKRETILSKISTASDATEITVTDEVPVAAGPAPKPEQKHIPAHERPPVIVKIALGEATDGEEAVPLSLNGKAMLVPRGRWCQIPYAYYAGPLLHAVEDRYEPLKDGGIKIKPRQVPRFPHEVWVGEGEPREGVLRPLATAQKAA